MSFKRTMVVCLVCQCAMTSSAMSPCTGGHYQCQICSIRLNGICGICMMPVELQANTQSDMLLGLLPDIEKIITEKAMRGDLEKDAEVTDISAEREEKNSLKKFAQSDNQMYSLEPLNRDEFLSAALLEILKSLHDTKCSSSCKTFDYCIRQLLMQFFYPNDEHSTISPEDVKKSSLSVLLNEIHEKICGVQCKTIESCLISKFEGFVSQQGDIPINTIDYSLQASSVSDVCSNFEALVTSYDQKDYPKETHSSFFHKESNVIRSCFRTFEIGKTIPRSLLPQFEIISTFPTSKSPTKKDLKLPFFFESNNQNISTINCPLPECNFTVEDRFLYSHFLENHKRYTFELLLPNECKLFFIDPSILECNEISCIATFEVPDIFRSSKEKPLEKHCLPIFVMAYKGNLRDLYSKDIIPSSQNISNNIPKAEVNNVKDNQDLIDSEVAETIYGIRKKIKSNPVKWAHDDILIIYPLAPIPKGKSVRASMTVFTPENSTTNSSVSFCMRSIEDSTEPLDLMGSSDTLCLTSVDIAALTLNGEQAIHCQLMCKF